MPLAKRSVAPAHLCQAALPEGISSELECVTNATLSAIIRQLSSLSKQAEDVFGELFSEANTFYLRANTLQDRIERLTYKVTQLDSGIEEVSLQDINMCKAFRSATMQDQQVVSKSTIPNCVAETYNRSDKPPSLNILSAYRDDHIEGMKFYTDPSYFFHLWKDKMFQDTEDKREEKRRQQEQKLSMDRTMSWEAIKVHKAHNCHQQWNTLALDMELRLDHCSPTSIHQGASSERSLSTEAITHCPDIPNYPVPVYHTQAPSIQGQRPPFMTPPLPEDGALDSLSPGAEHEYHIIGVPLDMAVGAGAPIGYNGRTQALMHLPPTQHPPPGGGANGKIMHSPADSGLTNSDSPLPSIVAFYTSTTLPSHFIPQTPVPPPSQPGPISSALSYPLSSDPPCGPTKAPPPSVAPPPLALTVSPHSVGVGKGAYQDSQPITEGCTDLLSAIRMGIQLKKVKEHHQHQAKHECLGNDVATILSRRIAVEHSDSGDDSELHGNEWSD